VEAIFNWLVELNQNNHVAFGVLTVACMAGIGGLIAVVAEAFFAALGIRSDKIEIQH
jgi:hypothetical protein